MKVKKEWIALFVGVLIVANILNIIAVLTMTEYQLNNPITGKAVRGRATICISRPATFETIPILNATSGTAFTYQVTNKFHGDNSSLAYYDNTSLFEINQSGYISFTPTSTQVGTHDILITAEDNSGCLEVNSTTTFLLNIVSGTGTPTPETPSTSSSSGGGGGGAAAIIPKLESSFKVSKKTIQTTIKTSQESQQVITVTNDGETTLEVSITDYPNIIDLSPASFTLAPGTTQDLTLIINPQHASPNIYTGQIVITAGSLTKTIDVIVQVESEVVIFDGKVELFGETNRVFPGSTLQAEISLGGLIPGEVTLQYLILDAKGNSYPLGSEIIGVEGEIKITREFKVPDNLETGDYVLVVKMIAGESFATATESFKVPPSTIAGQAFATGKTALSQIALPLMFLALLTIAVIVYTLHLRTKKHGEMIKANHRLTERKEVAPAKPITKTIIKTKTIIQPKTIIRTKTIPAKDTSYLRHKLALIQEGYKEGAIDGSTYRKSKEKIEKMLKN